MNTYCEPDHVNFVKRNRVLLADILYDHELILAVFLEKYDLPDRETRNLVQLPFHPSLPPLPPSTLYIYILWRLQKRNQPGAQVKGGCNSRAPYTTQPRELPLFNTHKDTKHASYYSQPRLPWRQCLFPRPSQDPL